MPRAFFKSQFFKSQNHVLNHLAYLHAQSPLFSGTSNIPLETAQQMVSTFDKPCFQHGDSRATTEGRYSS